MNAIIEMLSYGFMQRAFITGIVIAIACSLLGVILVLRKLSLIGDGLAHISFGGVASGILFNVKPFVGALIFGLLGALGINKLRDKAKLHGDSAIGIVSHASLGLGIFIISIANGFNVDIMNYLFGSILAISNFEVYFALALAVIVILVIKIFYDDIFSLTFDEEAAKVSGVNVNLMNYLIVSLTAITVVSAMKVVGLMLASALIILPSSSALQLKFNFKKTLLFSSIISVFTVVSGLVISYFLGYATSGTIILLNLFIFLIILAVKSFKK